jgi:hypothetical protein
MLQSEQNVMYFHVSAAMMLIIFSLNSNQRENLILKSSYKKCEFHALILFLPNCDIELM